MMGVVYGIGTLVSVVGQIVVIVTVAGVVKRNRPDAYGALLVWSACSLGATILFSIVGNLGPILFARGSADGMFQFQVVQGLLHIPITIGLFVALVVGLGRLARPPEEPLVRGEPPYR
jgi:hypothetical protein